MNCWQLFLSATSPPSFAIEVFVHCEGETRFRRLCQPFLYSHSSSNVLEVEVFTTLTFDDVMIWLLLTIFGPCSSNCLNILYFIVLAISVELIWKYTNVVIFLYLISYLCCTVLEFWILTYTDRFENVWYEKNILHTQQTSTSKLFCFQ